MDRAVVDVLKTPVIGQDEPNWAFWPDEALYERKRSHYGIDRQLQYDPDLKRLFSAMPSQAAKPSAASFLNRFRREVRRKVASWTGEYQYTIDQVLEDMIRRCRELDLRVPVAEEQAKLDFTILLTVHTMNFLRSGRHRVAL